VTISGNITQLLPFKAQTEGWTLSESEDFVELFYHGKQAATFSAHGAKIEKVNKFIDEYEVSKAL
jgi:hypothetical protein